MRDIHVTILNWEKYQFRKEVKNPSWFRLENKFWNDSQVFYFSAEERWVWVCLLSIASQKQSPDISFSAEWFSQESRVGIVSIDSALEKLARNECVTYTSRPCDSTRHNITRHNKTEQDKTKQVCVELKQVSVTPPTVIKKDLSFFINQKLLELYPQEYLDREKVKMEMWLATNGHKRPKSDRGMVRFVTSWLSRGWDQYRRGLQSNASKEKSFSEIWAEEEAKRIEENGH
jgi:hypothetical protein